MAYTVKSGDSLWSIARANGLTLDELLAQNPDIDNPALIRPGQVINLPGDEEPDSAASSTNSDGTGSADAEEPLPEPETAPASGAREGARESADTFLPAGAAPGTAQVGTAVLPRGMRLVQVNNPAGSDEDALFFAVGTVYGIEVAYEIGTKADLIATFGSTDAFPQRTTVFQHQFDNAGILTVGPVDEILGATESLQAVYERDMRAAGLESPPAWMVADPAAMATFVTGINEGWSAERTWQSLSSLDSFKDRFSGIATVQDQLGSSSMGDAVAEYLDREAQIRSALRRFRGPQTDLSTETVSSLIGSGWEPVEVSELLELEREVHSNQAALDNINEILAYRGLDLLTPDDFVDYLRDEKRSSDPDFTPGGVFEAVNDALRMTALEKAGLDVSAEVAESLGSGFSYSIESPDHFNDEAQYVAGVVAANRHSLDLGSYGLDQDAVVKHFLGESDDPEVGRKLERLGRERGIASQGYAATSAYIDAGGRLRAQGLADL